MVSERRWGPARSETGLRPLQSIRCLCRAVKGSQQRQFFNPAFKDTNKHSTGAQMRSPLKRGQEATVVRESALPSALNYPHSTASPQQAARCLCSQQV